MKDLVRYNQTIKKEIFPYGPNSPMNRRLSVTTYREVDGVKIPEDFSAWDVNTPHSSMMGWFEVDYYEHVNSITNNNPISQTFIKLYKRNVFKHITRPYVLHIDGLIRRRPKGQCSGSFGTTRGNSEIHLAYNILRFEIMKKKKYPVEIIMEMSNILGDDGLTEVDAEEVLL